MSELIPYVRETFRRHLNQAEAVLLVDFDKLKRVRVFGSSSGVFRVATTTIRYLNFEVKLPSQMTSEFFSSDVVKTCFCAIFCAVVAATRWFV